MFKKGEFDYSFAAKKQHAQALRILDLKLKRGERSSIEEISKKMHQTTSDKAKELLSMVVSEPNRTMRIQLHKGFELFLKKNNLSITEELSKKIRDRAYQEG